MNIYEIFEKVEKSNHLIQTLNNVEKQEKFIRYVKNEDKRIIAYYRYVEFDKYVNNCFILNNVSASIFFPEIEKIIRPEFEKDGDIGKTWTIGIDEHLLIFGKLKMRGEKYFEDLHLNLINDEAMEKAIFLIQKFIKEYAEPFFNYWTDIRCFLPFIEIADGRRLNDYFAGYPTERKMIIWHLCNHPKSNEFTYETLKSWEEYSAANPSDGLFKKWTKNMQRIVKELSKTPPLYEWDDSYLKLPS